MIPARLRAGLVIGAVVVASAIAGAAIDRAFLARRGPPRDGRRGGPPTELEQRRRTQMLDNLTRELSLTATQRAGIDSIFQRTDSTLRAMGYGTIVGGGVGQVNAIMRVPGGYEGVADPRGAGRPAGY